MENRAEFFTFINFDVVIIIRNGARQWIYSYIWSDSVSLSPPSRHGLFFITMWQTTDSSGPPNETCCFNAPWRFVKGSLLLKFPIYRFKPLCLGLNESTSDFLILYRLVRSLISLHCHASNWMTPLFCPSISSLIEINHLNNMFKGRVRI